MRKKTTLSAIFPIMIICTFIVSSLIILLFGLNGYQGMKKQSNQSQQITTALAYLKTKIQSAEGINIEETDGMMVLKLSTQEDIIYNTYIYQDEHYIKEISLPGTDFTKEDGTPLFPADVFKAEFKNGLLEIQMEYEGVSKIMQIFKGVK